MRLKIGLLTLFSLLLSFSLVTYHFSLPNVLAQVTTGSYFIGDISIDEGGGKMTSGAYSLNNTSIGQPFAGAYYVNNQLVVGSGHAYKLDPYPVITVNNLTFTTGPGGTDDASNIQRYSGLRTTEGGLSFYNALSVSPNVSLTNGNPTQISLVGVAFTENRTDLTKLEDITASAHGSNGFVLLYANTQITRDYYDRTRSASLRRTFDARTYQAFINGSWKILEVDGPKEAIKNNNNQILAEVYVTSLGGSLPPLKPKFNIDFYKALQDRTWETYTIVSSVLPDIIRHDIPN